MVTVYSFPAGFGQPSLSPFCTKALVHLQLAGVSYTLKVGNPQKAPTGKLPYARFDGPVVAGSDVIAEEALRQGLARDLDAELGPEQRATAHLVRRTLEESLYFTLIHARWVTDEGWVEQRPRIAVMLPAPLRGILPGVFRRGVKKALAGQGTGRRPRAEIEACGVADIEAVEALAADAPFFFGDALTSVDVVIHAFVGCARASAHDNPLTRAARAAPRLCRIIDGVEAAYREAGGQDT